MVAYTTHTDSLHDNHDSPPSVTGMTILGTICAFACLWSSSLIAPIMIHALKNVVALFQAITTDGFPIIDRGVTFGLIFVSPIITLILIYGIRNSSVF